MATVKTKMRSSSVSTKEGILFYQVIHNRIARQINTGYKLYPSEWSNERSDVLLLSDIDESRRKYLLRLKNALIEDTTRLKNIIGNLDESGGSYFTDKVVELYYATIESLGFISFTRTLINQLNQIGKRRTAETYTTAMNSFLRFRGEMNDVPLDVIDSNLIVAYETYLKSVGICPNTTSFYMRSLRAIYNRAVEKELTPQRNPFKHVYTGIDKTIKRAVPLNIIRQIRDLDLTLSPMLDYARDIFMFSFYTRGMSLIDMAYLKKKNLHNGILSYRRQKTNQQLFIKWEKPMQDIVNKYNTSATPYLLPIIRETELDARRIYRNAAHLINAKLRKIGEQLDLPIPLTSYVARHTWASIAKSKNVPVATISEAMGHDSEKTTRIYLASLDNSIVDKANKLILRLL